MSRIARPEWFRLRVESSLLERARFVAMLLAVCSALGMIPSLIASHHDAALVAAAAAVLVGLAGWWIAGYRRRSFPVLTEPLEVLCVLFVLHLTPGNPLLPLTGLLFRCLYGSSGMAWPRYVAWMAAMTVAHMYRGGSEVHADLARSAGVALVPLMANFLRSSVASLETSERRLASLIRNSTDVVTVVGPDLRVQWQADSVLKVLGWHRNELLGHSLEEIVHSADRAKLRSYVAPRDVTEREPETLALRLRHRDGGHRDFEVVIADRRDDPSVAGFVLNMRDATERLGLEADLRALARQREHDALHDPLTALPNRRSLFALMDQAITAAGAAGSQIALLMIDLDRFKELNDSLGHSVGDQILREIRPRLLSVVGDSGLVARLGGDEFAVLLRTGQGTDVACELAERLCEAISMPFEYEGLTLILEASVGIAVFPEHGTDADWLLRHADIAMYEAKRQRSGYEVYRPGTGTHTRESLALLGELPAALQDGQLISHYQPKFSLATGELTGVEALVRWQHPERGLLMPGDFLPPVERTGLMRLLTTKVLADAVEQAARWSAAGLRIPVAINLSPPDLIDARLTDDVRRLLSDHRLEPELLEFEVTERIIEIDPERIGATLASLRALGVTIALDDFGTGSSSLSFLRRLPVQVLKIDKSFVRAASAGDPADVALVANIIGLAEALGLRSIAEGIETDADRALLAELGCEQGQGFGLAHPMSAELVVSRFGRRWASAA